MDKIDPYLNPMACKDRLKRELKEHGSLVVAVDFDGTIFDYHGVGFSFPHLNKLVRDMKDAGFYIIIFTANPDHDLIKRHLAEKVIPYDSINENPPFFKGPPNSKIYYNALLDDRAGLSEVYDALRTIVDNLD